ncbi:MAG TPA: tricarboxylate transporter [Halothiobacillaceae bacterium]|nr:tricarboxylate transporter [Halothiobacillaceae bacterium]
MGHMIRAAIFGLGVAAFAAVGYPPSVANAADLKGETITWTIPFSEGGGSGRWARFVAPLLEKQLGATIRLKFVPGGGSTKGANLYASRARANGLEVLGTSGSTQFPYLLGDRRVNYEYKDWRPILAYATGGVVYVTPELGVKTAAELVEKNPSLVYGSQGATSLDLVPLLAFEMLGLDVKAVFGMKGRAGGRKAFMTGETNIDYQTSAAYLSKVVPLVEEGSAIPIMSWGSLDDDGNLIRDPNFPDLPHFAEVYEQVKGEKPSGLQFDAWKAFFVAGFPAQKFMVVPKETPDDVVKTYQDAIRAMFEDPEYIANKDEKIGTYPQVTGAAAETRFAAATSVPAEAKEWVRNWLTEKYDVKF